MKIYIREDEDVSNK